MNRVEVEIDLGAIRANYLKLREATPGKKLLAVVKADGYGLDGAEVALALDDVCDFFGAATLEEGERLREKGVGKDILILGYVPFDELPRLSRCGLIGTIYDRNSAGAYSDWSKSVPLRAHIAINTGMNRLGFEWNDYAAVGKLYKEKNLSVEGIFTHLSSAGTDRDFTEIQLRRFEKLLRRLSSENINCGLVHCRNSAGILENYSAEIAEGRDYMSRAGIALYGLYPNVGSTERYGLKNAVKISSRVVQVRDVAPGGRIGYDGTFTAEIPMRVAVVAAGYADGVPRSFSNAASVNIKGKKAAVVGKVCMDYTMIDVTGMADIGAGDEVVFYGGTLGVGQLLELGVFPYEFLCNIGARAEKRFVGGQGGLRKNGSGFAKPRV